eukprot:TRINITY_DN17029_c0_g1_i1.p1 TRINITY_DN17029_c0_g1~~TRINITY_DN17029_c0_g1_i1.p1  ORF type:complete len:169 (-),score=39.65 TRINITY_DN17029_c0_g1_i1:13-519(-)
MSTSDKQVTDVSGSGKICEKGETVSEKSFDKRSGKLYFKLDLYGLGEKSKKMKHSDGSDTSTTFGSPQITTPTPPTPTTSTTVIYSVTTTTTLVTCTTTTVTTSSITPRTKSNVVGTISSPTLHRNSDTSVKLVSNKVTPIIPKQNSSDSLVNLPKKKKKKKKKIKIT